MHLGDLYLYTSFTHARKNDVERHSKVQAERCLLVGTRQLVAKYNLCQRGILRLVENPNKLRAGQTNIEPLSLNANPCVAL